MKATPPPQAGNARPDGTMPRPLHHPRQIDPIGRTAQKATLASAPNTAGSDREDVRISCVEKPRWSTAKTHLSRFKKRRHSVDGFAEVPKPISESRRDWEYLFRIPAHLRGPSTAGLMRLLRCECQGMHLSRRESHRCFRRSPEPSPRTFRDLPWLRARSAATAAFRVALPQRSPAASCSSLSIIERL